MDEILDEGQGNEEGAGGGNAAPEPITKADLADILDRIDRRSAAMEERIEQFAISRTAPVQRVEEPDIEITDEDEGDDRVRKIIRQEIRGVTGAVNKLAQVSLGTIGKLSQRQVIDKLPMYTRFKKEIDARLATLTPDVAAQPEALELTYRTVVAEHLDEIMAEREQEITRRLTTGSHPGNPRGTRPNAEGKGGEKIPTPQELGFTEDAIAMVEARGGWDAWARRMSGNRYKGYADYAKAKMKTRVNGGKPVYEGEA